MLTLVASACEAGWYEQLTGRCPPGAGACNEVEDEGGREIGPPPPPDNAAFPSPAGLPSMNIPDSNPLNRDKVELGRQLFFDARLSRDGSISCETCHLESLGWADGRSFSFKIGGAVNTRHTPTLFNVGYEQIWYWDGRSPVLEDQIVATLRGQMGTDDAKLDEVARYPEYEELITQAFGRTPWGGAVPMAIAAYLRTLRSGDSRWDRYQAGDASALDANEEAGWKLFAGKAHCNFCHIPPLFANGAFHDLGLERGKLRPDRGRGAVTKEAGDLYAFRTPTLRSVSRSAPYFHDGSAATLEAAVRFMLGGGQAPDSPPAAEAGAPPAAEAGAPPAADAGARSEPEDVDPLFQRIDLTDDEVMQLVAFLRALDPIEN